TLCGVDLHRAAHRPGRRRLRHRREPRAPDRRRRQVSRRAPRQRLRANRHRPARDGRRAPAHRAGRQHACPRGRADGARGVDRDADRVMQEYQRPRTGPGGLRLHLNENTGGPSPRVLEALRALTPEQLAFYPEYDEVARETAAYLGVPESCLLLTNGLDEGIFIAAVLALQRRPADGPPEAVIVEPTFDMYAISAAACGAAVVRVGPRPDFRFPVDAVIAAITPRTRVVYVTSPNNPTGVRIANQDLHAVARALPPDALLFVDEAYHDFCGDTLIPDLGSLPNTVVGRTFAKAHGLAALRAGALVGVQETIAALRPV